MDNGLEKKQESIALETARHLRTIERIYDALAPEGFSVEVGMASSEILQRTVEAARTDEESTSFDLVRGGGIQADIINGEMHVFFAGDYASPTNPDRIRAERVLEKSGIMVE